MSILTEWDISGKKYYHAGTDRGMLYVWNKSIGKYGIGVPWNGLIGVNESPSGGDPTDLWADNQKYLSIRSAEQYGFTINAYQHPYQFNECDGKGSPFPGINIGQQTRAMFGFSYRSLIGNDTELNNCGYIIHLIYGATCSPASKDRSTVNDSPSAVEFSWECTTTPVPIPGFRPTATIEIDSRDYTTKEAKEKLAEFEEILYGKIGNPNIQPKLLTPIEIINFFKKPTPEELFILGVGRLGVGKLK